MDNVEKVARAIWISDCYVPSNKLHIWDEWNKDKEKGIELSKYFTLAKAAIATMNQWQNPLPPKDGSDILALVLVDGILRHAICCYSKSKGMFFDTLTRSFEIQVHEIMCWMRPPTPPEETDK